MSKKLIYAGDQIILSEKQNLSVLLASVQEVLESGRGGWVEVRTNRGVRHILVNATTSIQVINEKSLVNQNAVFSAPSHIEHTQNDQSETHHSSSASQNGQSSPAGQAQGNSSQNNQNADQQSSQQADNSKSDNNDNSNSAIPMPAQPQSPDSNSNDTKTQVNNDKGLAASSQKQ